MVQGVFTGITGLDIAFYQNEFPKENFKSKTNDYQTFIGGPAANAAITYAILGGNATLITCLGDTTIAKAIKSELFDVYNVTVIDMAAGSNLLPSLSSVLVNIEKATRTIWSGQQQFSIHKETSYEKLINEASFCFSDCNLPEVSIDFLKKSKALNKKIILDSGSWKPHFPECLKLADEVIASVNCQPRESDLLTFLENTPVNNIAITDGENDTLWFEKSNSGVIKVPKVQAVDSLAAGDVLHGAYCYYRYHEGLSFVSALEKATIVASESVKYYGAREGVYHVVEQTK
ncbi:PfkB family carbohydrate kinase [Bacillus sp. 37MA]|uniref:PfkB family carbohydrate kinase n=1 Tax=Bacillus sp. 37MA TaxID=1132442 RepID=UPI00036A2BC3|nr:PfkB family carbohydrate kinase [Bacillus sp. 37MA]